MKQVYILFSFLIVCSFASSQTIINHERIYLGTGEYSPPSNWDAIHRLDTTENFNSEPGAVQYTPEGTIPMKSCFIGGTTFLNFVHGLYLQASQDRMYAATIFTNQNNYLTSNSDTAVGAIAIFDNISTINSASNPPRYIFGPNTQLKQPHACWLDESKDILYVANTFGGSILAFNNASTISGDVAPDRIIYHDSLGAPVYIYMDTIIDRMFVCAMPMMGGPPTPLKSQVAIYNNVSAINGNIEPPIRITGPNTRLMIGNQTVHNAWFNPGKQQLAVGHHTNELLMFNLNTVNWGTVTPIKYNLTPRVIRVDDPGLGFDSSDVNLYGFYWDLPTDRIFCSVGVDNPGGGPTNSCPPEAVKIFSNISDTTVSGVLTPDRVIYWSNCSTYYPPQPIWLQKYTSSIGMKEEPAVSDVKIYPNPASERITLSMNVNADINVTIINVLGKELYSKQITARGFINENIDLTGISESIVFLVVSSGSILKTYKITVEH